MALRQNYGISKKEADGVLQRALQAALVLKKRCEAGQLRFDLAPEAALDVALAKEESVQC